MLEWLVLDIDNLSLSEAAAERETQNTLQIWAIGLLAVVIAFYAITSFKQAKKSSEETEVISITELLGAFGGIGWVGLPGGPSRGGFPSECQISGRF